MHLLADRRVVIATANVDVLAICSDRSLPVDDLSAYLEDDGQRFQDEAIQICERMATALAEELPETYRHLAFHVTFDLLSPITWFLQVGAMVENLVKQKYPNRAFCFGDIPHVVGWDPRPLPFDTGNCIVRWILERHGIPHELLYLAKVTPVSSQKIPPKKIVGNKEPPPGIEVRSSISVLSMAAMTGAIGKAEQSQILTSGGAQAQRAFAAFPDWGLCFLPITSGLTKSEIGVIVERVVARLRSQKELPDCLLFNSYLGELWLAWSALIGSGLSFFRRSEFIADLLRPRVVLTAYDVFGHTRCQTEGFLQAGVVPVSIYHSGFNGATKRGMQRQYRAVGHLAGWSEIEIQVVSFRRKAGFHCRAIGSLRTDIDQAISTAHRSSRGGKAEETPSTVLFITSRIADYAPMQSALSEHVALWRELRGYCARRVDLKFLLKKHPRYDYAEVYGETSDKVADQRGLIPVDSLADALRSADLVVTVNMVSTAWLDAVCAGKPILFLDSFDFCLRSRWAGELGVEVVSDVPALERRIDELLNDPAQADALVTRMQGNLKKFVVATGPEAVRRLWEFVEELCPDVWDAPKKEQRPPNPLSLWCWDFARVADSILRGESDPARRQLAARFPDIPAAEGECPVDLEQLASKVFHQVLWKLQDQWGQPSAEIIRAINDLLPAKYRMSFRTLRPYLVQALLLDANDHRRSIGRRAYSKLAAYALAPGRLRG